MKRLMITMSAVLTVLCATSAYAVRPFVTDDARIVDYGQFETESWLETTRDTQASFSPAPGLNIMAGTSPTDWLEILVGGGIGNNNGGGLAVANPVLTAKMLVLPITENAPGFAVSTATAFNTGRGDMYEEGRVYNLIGMNSWKLNDTFLHINYGVRHDENDRGKHKTRPYWGVGFETPIYGEKLNAVAEVFAGDPLVPDAPNYAAQWGVRYHHSDVTQFDVTFGADPYRDADNRHTNRYEYTAQIGMRFVFDWFTRDGLPGNPNGARGLFSK